MRITLLRLSDQRIPGVLCFCREDTVQWCNTLQSTIC